MKILLIIWLCAFHLSHDGLAQADQKTIETEAQRLYSSEMASWKGTDLLLQKYPDKQKDIGGYFSYSAGSNTVCLFYSKANKSRVIISFTFDNTFSTSTAIINEEERELTVAEQELLAIRQQAVNEYTTDKLFKRYENINPNFIPLIDGLGKRVYIFSGPIQSGVVVFGNDYLITFDNKGRIKEKRALHQNIIIMDAAGKEGKELTASMHTHLPKTGELMTATDLCTLMLYCPYVQWRQHYVISSKYVSVYDCVDGFAIMTRKAWDRINKSQSGK